MRGVCASVAFLFAGAFPPHGDMDSAARGMAADMPAFERVRDVLAAQPGIRWVAPSDDMNELSERNPYPVTPGARAAAGGSLHDRAGGGAELQQFAQ
jgi:hypothetical protein